MIALLQALQNAQIAQAVWVFFFALYKPQRGAMLRAYAEPTPSPSLLEKGGEARRAHIKPQRGVLYQQWASARCCNENDAQKSPNGAQCYEQGVQPLAQSRPLHNHAPCTTTPHKKSEAAMFDFHRTSDFATQQSASLSCGIAETRISFVICGMPTAAWACASPSSALRSHCCRRVSPRSRACA